jgi:hypothetical protein
MIDPATFLREVIDPGLHMLAVPDVMVSDEARVMLLAIALQESDLEYRRQIGGPARGFWQFEAGGGVQGVMSHVASCEIAEEVCGSLRVPFENTDVHEALAWSDPLAVAFARLLLWTDAAPLPAVGDVDRAWGYYLRNWRPGKPHPETWVANYALAVETVNAQRS